MSSPSFRLLNEPPKATPDVSSCSRKASRMEARALSIATMDVMLPFNHHGPAAADDRHRLRTADDVGGSGGAAAHSFRSRLRGVSARPVWGTIRSAGTLARARRAACRGDVATAPGGWQ